MHGKSIAWVRDRCTLEGAPRALLWAVAGFAGNHHADCTASAATLARASGLSSRHVKRLLPELVAMGVLEQLEPGHGRRPASHRIAPPLWVEGEASASGLVEGQAGVAGVIESTTELASGDTRSPLGPDPEPASGDIGDPVVVTSEIRSGDTPPPLSSTDGPQVKFVEDKSIEEKVFNTRAGSELDISPQTNNGRRGWVPREEYVRRRAAQIAATDGVVKAEAYLAKCQATQERQERMREAGQAAQAVQAAEDPTGTKPAVGGYGRWVPAWAASGPPQLEAPAGASEVLGTSRRAVVAFAQTATVAIVAGDARVLVGVAATAGSADGDLTVEETA
jgi:hypothetical protein